MDWGHLVCVNIGTKLDKVLNASEKSKVSASWCLGGVTSQDQVLTLLIKNMG